MQVTAASRANHACGSSVVLAKTSESGSAALQDACAILAVRAVPAVRNMARESGGGEAPAARAVAQLVVCASREARQRRSWQTGTRQRCRLQAGEGCCAGSGAEPEPEPEPERERAPERAAAVGFAVAERHAWTSSAPRHGSAILTSRPSSSPRILAAGHSHVHAATAEASPAHRQSCPEAATMNGDLSLSQTLGGLRIANPDEDDPVSPPPPASSSSTGTSAAPPQQP
ncbi:Serine/threonine-protein kinase ksg1, partial [Stagonosporopsis vannaccii]